MDGGMGQQLYFVVLSTQSCKICPIVADMQQTREIPPAKQRSPQNYITVVYMP